MKHKVKFRSMSDIKAFAEEMNGFSPDVNLYFGHQVFDAKSIIALMSLQLYKEYEIELLTDNKMTQSIFATVVSRFGG